MEPLPSLVYYAAVVKTTAAVAKNTIVLADYEDAGPQDFAQMAAKCLEYIPNLHNSFSYTTSHRMFICLIESHFIYCAIMDEALSKAKAFMFLEHVRDAFKVLLQQRDMSPGVLAAHSLHGEMNPFFTHLATSLVGIPQSEKVQIKEEELLLQAQKDEENDFEINSPSTDAPLKEMSDEDFDFQSEDKPSSASSRSPHVPLIGKGKRGKKTTREYDKEINGIAMDSGCEALNKDRGLDIMIDDNSPGMQIHAQKSGWQAAEDRWWCNVKFVIILDLVICIILLVIWLAVCGGVQCMKEN